MLPATFRSIGLSVQEKNRAAILDYRLGQFKLLLIYKSPRCFLPSFKSIRFSVQEKKRKTDLQDGHHGGHLGFPIGTILVIFDPQITPMLPTKFRINRSFGIDEEAKTRFSRWPPSWISGRNDFSYVLIYRSPQCFLSSFESIGLSVQEKRKIDF